MNTQDLALRIADLQGFEGYQFECQPIPGDIEVLQVTVEGFEEIPAYVSVTDTQILCITYLFTEEEIQADSRMEMLEEMLELNIPIPLSSFAKIGDRYVIFGALAVESNIEDICHEIITLSENAVEAISALEEFLK